ncbi:CRAL-TRIO domain-containing protein [Peziza echinospora]|nr:CRAL-TRIO domain-containing protein [Peziza echinospora]
MSTTAATDFPVPPQAAVEQTAVSTPAAVVQPTVAAEEAAAPVETTPVVDDAKTVETAGVAPTQVTEEVTKADEKKEEAEAGIASASTPAVETSAAPVSAPTEPTITEIVTSADQKPISTISSSIAWPALEATHPLAQFQARLPELLEAADHNLIWGITLSATAPIPFHTTLILQKFLRANFNNVEGAYTQLLDTLKWRKEYNPEAAVAEEFSEAKFGGLGWVSKLKVGEGVEKVVTWNIYGACKDTKKTFGDLDSFLRWRIALMELGVNALELPKATVPIPDYNPTAPGTALDPYQMIQLHDYQTVSFFRLDSATKAASKKTIEVMAHYYPELLSSKLFVNVPVVMGWVFSAMKAFLSKETIRKFKVITSGRGVAAELGQDVPKQYGGKGADLPEVGLSPKLVKDAAEPEPVAKLGKKASKASLDKTALKEKASKATLSEKTAPRSEREKKKNRRCCRRDDAVDCRRSKVEAIELS